MDGMFLAVMVLSTFGRCVGWSFSGIQSAGEDKPVPDSQLYTIALQKQMVPVYISERLIGHKFSYFGQIQVSGSRDKYSVVFDTGSGHIILPSALCRADACLKHRQYSRIQSTTAKSIRTVGSVADWISVKITFGTGQVTGQFVNDVVCLSSSNSSCISINLVTATNMTENPFNSFEFDGVFGLGLHQLSLNNDFHFIEGMTAHHASFLPQFAMFLASRPGEQSQISFGGHDPGKAMEEMVWSNVARSDMGYWQLQIKSVYVGDSMLDYCADGDCYAILDSGSSMLGVPSSELVTLHRLLSREVPQNVLSDEGFKVDCRDIPGENLTFDLGDFKVVLGSEDLARPDPWSKEVQDGNDQNVTKTFCRHLLLPVNIAQPVGPKIFVWGAPVLRRYYSVFDVGNKRVGMALARHTGHGYEDDSYMVAESPVAL